MDYVLSDINVSLRKAAVQSYFSEALQDAPFSTSHFSMVFIGNCKICTIFVHRILEGLIEVIYTPF